MIEWYFVSALANIVVLMGFVAYYFFKKKPVHGTDIHLGLMWVVISLIPFVNALAMCVGLIVGAIFGFKALIEGSESYAYKLARAWNKRIEK